MSKSEPYFIEICDKGCTKCSAGKSWDVIDPDGTALGKIWSNEEDAAWMAEMMNEAYQMGLEEGLRRKK